MIQVSSAVREMIEAGTLPEFQAEITYADGTGEVLDASRFLSGSPVIKKSITDDGVFTIGGAVIGSFNFSLINDDGHFDETDFTGAKIVPQAGYDETWYPLGTFYLASHKSAGCMIVCTAYDALALLDDVMYTVWPSTFLAAAQTICASRGLTLATTSFTGASMTFEDPTEAMTERMTLAYMAQCTGNHIRIDAAGQMVIERVTGDSKTVEAVFDANLQTSELAYTGIRITPYGGDNASLFGADGNVLTVSDNPLLTSVNLSQVGQMLQSFLSTVNGFTAGTATIPADFTIEPGDTLTITNRRTVSFLVTNLTYKLGVQESVSCDAEDPVTNDLRPRATEMIKVTAVNAEKMVHEALSDISELQDFESNTTSWMEETEQGLVTIRQNHTALSGVVDKTVKESVQLWFTKANTSAPNKPSAEVTSTSTAGNAWRKVVPAFNASYPNYFYCWQYKYADGTFGWSDVVRDIAMGETQGVARDAKNTADNALPAATFTSFESTTFAEIVDEVDEQSTTLKNMTTALSMNADGTSAATDVIHRTSALEQSLESITTRVGKTETSLAGFYATCSTAAGTKAKVATITPTVTGWTLYTGATITVKFTNANTNTAPTLNVNGTGATAIKTYSGEALSADEYKWPAGATFAFTYNGTNWLMQDSTMAVRVASAETSITQNSEAIALRATKTEAQGYATTAEGNAKSDTTEKLKSYSTTTQMNSAIEQKANSIAVSVAETKISELKIGGRNLIINTYTPDVSAAAKRPRLVGQTANTIVNGVAYAVEHGIGDRSSEANHYRPLIRFGAAASEDGTMNGLEAGKTYTLSFDCRWKVLSAADAGSTAYIRAYVYDDHATQGTMATRAIQTIATATAGVEGRGRCEATFTLDSNVTMMALLVTANINAAENYAAGDYIELANIKLEEGDKATDWTPAPEDLEKYTDSAVTAAKAEIKVTTDGITSTVEKIGGFKYLVSATAGASWTGFLNYAQEGKETLFTIESGALGCRIGDNVYLKYKDTTNNVFRYIRGTVIEQPTADNKIKLVAQGYEDIRPVDTIKSTINQSADSVKIQAKHVDIEGAAIFSSGGRLSESSLNAAYDEKGAATAAASGKADKADALKNVSAKDQFYLSTSSTSATGGSWSDTVPAWTSGKYIWTRVATTKTPVSGSAVTTYSTAVYDQALTEALGTADGAAPKGSAVKRTQRIYCRKEASGAPDAPTAWVTATSNNFENWTKKIPRLTYNANGTGTKYLYLYTCEQYELANGTLGHTSVLLDDSTTIIDGGNIITNSVTANQLAANAVTAEKVAAHSISATHLTVADSTNLVTANENIQNSLPGQIWNGTSYEEDGSEFRSNYLLNISNGYIEKKTSSTSYMMLTYFMPNAFETGDELYYEFYAKADAATSVAISCWGYPEKNTSSYCSNSSTTGNIALTTTEKKYSGTIMLSSEKWSTGVKFYLLGINNNLSETTKTQIHLRKVIIRKKSTGELIVDGSITAKKIDVTDLFAQDITATGTITGSTLRGSNGAFTKGFDVDILFDQANGNVIDSQSDMDTTREYVRQYFKAERDYFRMGFANLYYDSEWKETSREFFRYYRNGAHPSMPTLDLWAHRITLTASEQVWLDCLGAWVKGSLTVDDNASVLGYKMVYEAGDVVNCAGVACAGSLTGANKTVKFFIPLQKPSTSGLKATLSGKWTIRHADGGYILNDNTLQSIGTVTAIVYELGIYVSIGLSNASSFTNNCPVVVHGGTGPKITFSA